MNRFSMVAAAVAATILAAPVVASAQSSTPVIDQRQENQEKRIDQGVQSGALNQPETRRLERNQAAIEKMETKAKSDGTVTRRERARLTKAQNRSSRRIWRQKHDTQVRQ
jgi:uncharacterized membrane protein YebE (DUF533 family)